MIQKYQVSNAQYNGIKLKAGKQLKKLLKSKITLVQMELIML